MSRGCTTYSSHIALGSWTVMDQAGPTVADGTWAASKDQKIWKGSWQARVRSGQLYSGTWRAQPQLLCSWASSRSAAGCYSFVNGVPRKGRPSAIR